MDELVKRLRRCSYSDPNGCEECRNCPNADNFYECKQKLTLQAADAIEQLIEERDAYRKAMTDEHNRAAKLTWEKEHCWIPVTEQLPETGVPTLICGDGNVVEQGFFDDEYGYWYDWGGNRTFVHHWMQLPEPPKEE